MTVNYVSLVCNYVDGQGNPVTKGTVTFTPNVEVLDTSTDHLVITEAPVIVSLAKTPVPTVQLAATDNANMAPAGWAWQVSPNFPGAPPGQQFSLPYSAGAVQYLSDLLPAMSAPGPTGGTLTGTLVLEGSPPLRIPAGAGVNKVLTSDGSGNAAWAPGASGTGVWFNVKDFGAAGNGGGNDTTAIQAAINAAGAVSGTVYFPHGVYTYTQLVLDAITGPVTLQGEGPERSILFPLSSASTPTMSVNISGSGGANINIAGLEFSLQSALSTTTDAIYVNNVNKLLIQNCKFRGGRRQIWLGYVSGSKISNTWHMNFYSCGLYVHAPNPISSGNPTGQQPNFSLESMFGQSTNVNAGVVCDAFIWVNGFCAGFTMDDCWGIAPQPNNGVAGTWAAGIRIDGPESTLTTGSFGHYALITNCSTDGVDGPGLMLQNARQIQYTTCFWGTGPAATGGTDAGIHIFGGCIDVVSGGGNWISGIGIAVDAAAHMLRLYSSGDYFPQTVTGGAIQVPSGATITDWYIGPNKYYVGQFPDAATAGRVLLAAPAQGVRPMQSPPTFMTSAANANERVQFYNPVAGLLWAIDVTDTGSGFRISDNASRVIFELVNGGGIQIGNQSGGFSTPASIRKITTQSTAYAGVASPGLAAGARDTITVTVTAGTMTTGDAVFANSTVEFAQGVRLVPYCSTATTLTVYVENNTAVSQIIGPCTIRTTVFQYANP